MIPRDEDTFECVSRERTGVWVGKPYDFPKDGVCVCVCVEDLLSLQYVS